MAFEINIEWTKFKWYNQRDLVNIGKNEIMRIFLIEKLFHIFPSKLV